MLHANTNRFDCVFFIIFLVNLKIQIKRGFQDVWEKIHQIKFHLLQFLPLLPLLPSVLRPQFSPPSRPITVESGALCLESPSAPSPLLSSAPTTPPLNSAIASISFVTFCCSGLFFPQLGQLHSVTVDSNKSFVRALAAAPASTAASEQQGVAQERGVLLLGLPGSDRRGLPFPLVQGPVRRDTRRAGRLRPLRNRRGGRRRCLREGSTGACCPHSMPLAVSSSDVQDDSIPGFYFAE